MSYDDPRCKAHCEKLEFFLWSVLWIAVGILLGFNAYKFLESL